MTTPYTIPDAPPLLAQMQLLAGQKSVITWIGANGTRIPLSGGTAPELSIQDGTILTSIKGVMGSWKHLDQASAHQDGATWLDAVWEPQEIDLTVTIGAQTPHGYRHAARQWMDSWDPKITGTLFWFTPELGEWWLTLRMLSEPQDEIKTGPAFQTTGSFVWPARADLPFWQSFDSSSSLVASGATTLVDPLGINANGFLSLFNRGDQASWPRYLVQGPLTLLTIADAGSGAIVSFGPVTAGETVLITTQPRIQSVTNLTSGANLYPLLSGRFQTSIPAFTTQRIAVSVTGATNGVTQINGSLTPYRKWPE